jgi:uncharacterized Zn-finger protein
MYRIIAHKQQDGSVDLTLHIVRPDLSGYNPKPVENPIPQKVKTANRLPVLCGGAEFPKPYKHPRMRKLVDIKEETLDKMYVLCGINPKAYQPKRFIEEVADIAVERPSLISEVLERLKRRGL